MACKNNCSGYASSIDSGSVATSSSGVSPTSKIESYVPLKSTITTNERESKEIHTKNLVESSVQKPTLSISTDFDGILEGQHLMPVTCPVPPPLISRWSQPPQDMSYPLPRTPIPLPFNSYMPGLPPPVFHAFNAGSSFNSGPVSPVRRPQSGLSGDSPAFNPSTPAHLIARNHVPYGLPTPPSRPSGSVEKVETLIRDMRLAPLQGSRGAAQNYGQYPQQQQGFVPFCNQGGPVMPPTGPRRMQYDGYSRPPRHLLSTQLVHLKVQKEPEVWINRLDRASRDLIITATGIKRNAARFTRTFDKYGNSNEVTVEQIYDAPEYDFVTDYKSWSREEKKAFLAKNFIEIKFDLKTPKEEAEALQRARETGDEDWTHDTAIDTIEALGPEFAEFAKKVVVTMVFPHNRHVPAPKSEPTESFKRKEPKNYIIVPVSLMVPQPPTMMPNFYSPPADVTSPNFLFLFRVAAHIETYTLLSHLTIILVVPANNRMPVTMPQLYHALPFYDLTFTNWDIKYLPERLSIPLLVTGWALGQLDRERNRVAKEKLEREKERLEREKCMKERLIDPKIIPSVMDKVEMGPVNWVKE